MEPVLVNPPVEEFGRVTAVLMGRGRSHHVSGFAGPLSLKSVISGSAEWSNFEGRFRMGPGSYLILNDRSEYSVDVESKEPVETFCVFFRRGLVEDAVRVVRSEAEMLLDEPDERTSAAFPEQVCGAGNVLTPMLNHMREVIIAGGDCTTDLMSLVGLLAGIRQLRAERACTRDELLRRVLKGRDYIESCLDTAPDLQEAARAAFLSPFHFHRSFLAVFGETPHVYSVRRRLERAKRAVAQSDQSLTTIALEAGFSTPSAFSAAFRNKYGLAPSEIRKNRKAAVHAAL